MRYRDLFEAAENILLFHGTSAARLQSILQAGLQPSQPDAAPDGRWATLGGVYLTSDVEYALKAGRDVAEGGPLAIIAVTVDMATAQPDEDVVEKTLVAAFTRSLDDWGIDDQYDCDLSVYADHEEQRPRDDMDDDQPEFDREQFFKDFWQTVIRNMAQLAGTAKRNDRVVVQRAVEMAVELAGDHVDHYREARSADLLMMQEWRAAKAALCELYPRLRYREQHAKAGIKLPHNVRVTKPIKRTGRNRIVAALEQQAGVWKLVFGTLPSELAGLVRT